MTYILLYLELARFARRVNRDWRPAHRIPSGRHAHRFTRGAEERLNSFGEPYYVRAVA